MVDRNDCIEVVRSVCCIVLRIWSQFIVNIKIWIWYTLFLIWNNNNKILNRPLSVLVLSFSKIWISSDILFRYISDIGWCSLYLYYYWPITDIFNSLILWFLSSEFLHSIVIPKSCTQLNKSGWQMKLITIYPQ